MDIIIIPPHDISRIGSQRSVWIASLVNKYHSLMLAGNCGRDILQIFRIEIITTNTIIFDKRYLLHFNSHNIPFLACVQLERTMEILGGVVIVCSWKTRNLDSLALFPLIYLSRRNNGNAYITTTSLLTTCSSIH